jgi:hypothetical protein
LDFIAYPEDVQKAMEEYSVHIYDPRFPMDNTWIPPPAPDTWEFIQLLGRAGSEGEDEEVVGERLANKNGIVQKFDTEADTHELLNSTSEAKLARAIDIGEEDEADEEEEEETSRGREMFLNERKDIDDEDED